MSTTRSTGSEPAAPIPGSYMALLSDALMLNQRGQHQEVIEITERIRSRIMRLPERRRSPGSELHEVLVVATALHADSSYKQGDIDMAEALWKELEQLDQDNMNRWRREPIIRRINRGELEPWFSELDRLVRESLEDGEGWLALAEAAMTINDIETLEVALDQAEMLFEEDDDEEALAAINLMRHNLLIQQGRYREALDAWYEAMEFDEELQGWSEGFVHKLLEVEEYDLALELLDDESFIEPEQWYYQAWIANRRGDSVRAHYLWRKVVDAEEDDEYSLVVTKAMSLCWLGRAKEAIAIALEEASILRYAAPALAVALALAWGMEGDVDSARADLTLATRRQEKIILLDRVSWFDFDTLIGDQAIKDELREFFLPG